jgi:hypothetical protein
VIGQTKREDGEGLFEPFADTRGGTRVAVLESTRQILQQTLAVATLVCL